jgi:hypothetical protein
MYLGVLFLKKKWTWWIIGLLSFIFVVAGYAFIIKWSMYQKFSAEVNAAIITALVTVPIGVFTVFGTVWITVVSIRKTVETAIMQQRTGVRDQLFTNRMEAYKKLLKQTLIYKEKNFGYDIGQIENVEDYTNWLYSFYLDNLIYLSDDIRFLINSFLDTSPFKLGGTPKNYKSIIDIEESKGIYRKIKKHIEDIGVLEVLQDEKIYGFDANELMLGIVNIDVISHISIKWFKKKLNKNIESPDVKKEVILKRFVGFLYESKDSKEILNNEYKTFHLNYFIAMDLYLNYFILSELDFKYIKNDINSLYYNQFQV